MDMYISLYNIIQLRHTIDITLLIHFPCHRPSKLPSYLLYGRTVFINGASHGIGRAIATSFACSGALMSSPSSLSRKELKAATKEAGQKPTTYGSSASPSTSVSGPGRS